MTNSEKLILTAIKYVGVKEDPTGFNPIIKLWMEASCKSLKLENPKDDSLFAWCACFLSNILIEAGIWKPDTMHIVRARDFQLTGQVVRDPEVGDIVVLERGPGKGHVGIFISETDGKYYLLSGNSGDAVTVWPFDKKRVLGIRRV